MGVCWTVDRPAPRRPALWTSSNLPSAHQHRHRSSSSSSEESMGHLHDLLKWSASRNQSHINDRDDSKLAPYSYQSTCVLPAA